MKKTTKFIIGAATVGVTFAATTAVISKVFSKAFKFDPDELYFSDEEVEKIENQARCCKSAADNCSENKIPQINFNGKIFTTDNGEVISDEETEKLINDNDAIIICIDGISSDCAHTEELISRAVLTCFDGKSKNFNPVSFLKNAYKGAEELNENGN